MHVRCMCCQVPWLLRQIKQSPRRTWRGRSVTTWLAKAAQSKSPGWDANEVPVQKRRKPVRFASEQKYYSSETEDWEAKSLRIASRRLDDSAQRRLKQSKLSSRRRL